MGFFVEGYDTGTKSVYGRLMTMPGKYVAGAPKGTSSFLKTVTLVR
jgi:hypothetical protein